MLAGLHLSRYRIRSLASKATRRQDEALRHPEKRSAAQLRGRAHTFLCSETARSKWQAKPNRPC